MGSNQLDDNVYLGLWTNWSRGATMGATLTLTREQGNYLIAFTASFVAFVAVHFWNIVVVACHRTYSGDSPRPLSTLHHQRQILLRNSANPEGAIASLVDLASAWWKPGSRLGLLRRTAPLFCLALLSWVAFTAAGGFSSTIASAVGNTVLLDDRHCAIPETPSADDINRYYSFISGQIGNSNNYAKQCYSNNASSLVDCARFLHSTIPWTADHGASCPFDETMCRTKSGNLRLDTGPIDSAFLGLNTPPSERFSYRYALECAPLVTEGFETRKKTANTTLVRYQYGNITDSDSSVLDYSYQVRDGDDRYQWLYDPGAVLLGASNFNVGISPSSTVHGEPDAQFPGSFVPLEELFRPDADFYIIFLSGGGVLFSEPWDDDWYRGTTPAVRSYNNVGGWNQLYKPAEAASPLGCIEQWQICNLAERYSDGSGCGPLGSLYDSFSGAAPFFNTTEEGFNAEGVPVGNRDATRLWWLKKWMEFNRMQVSTVIGLLGSNALVSSQALLQGIQNDIERDFPMWQLDVTNFFAAVMASVQSTFVNAPITAVTTDEAMRLPIPSNATDLRDLCGSQMIKSTAFTSFNVFGLCFTYGLGTIIIVASLALKPILGFLFRRYGYQAHQQIEWTLNGSLQLHRLAQEELGHGGDWSQCGEDVPTTEAEALLGPLDIRDQNHPVISKPGEWCSETKMAAAHRTSSSEGRSSSREGTVAADDRSKATQVVSVQEETQVIPTTARNWFPVSPIEQDDGNIESSAGESGRRGGRTDDDGSPHLVQ